ncbi:3'(2'),5'-bisphosphate nucleotidase [Candidatus Endolissoclinum faulkneri L2]|uniref:3'(2'),5'-bisphosphate nucleotidase CysQ n=1 Tax=Candidatus Endolissoclinum faulkneri L2 TaxID=1193729 RepID=K7ZCX0_9PROT|nr:3'(2'),5'-bisphosphate nucleotidase CysQ [Candidatus Endolissoclinum faulkneri]AFX98956.1 3'(2'),5'-bisphosphate nucleotidase [Candidatus Endolissoclinum faulkneri L2]
MPLFATVNPADKVALLNSVAVIARAAGEIELFYYRTDTVTFTKMDGSIVTSADQAADNYIVQNLNLLTPNIPVVAEESFEAGNIPDISCGRFWLVDSLDGTKEFVNNSIDFTVNIGLIWDGIPILGALHTPENGIVWGGILGEGAWEESKDGTRKIITVRKSHPDKLTIVASRNHYSLELDGYIRNMHVKKILLRGSALKFALLARGDADIYLRTSPTMEWDTAAGHALLLAAGGTMTKFDGSQLDYGKPKFLNDHFIARGR